MEVECKQSRKSDPLQSAERRAHVGLTTAALVWVLAFAPWSAWAVQISQSVVFETQAQSMWATGVGTGFDFDQFFGVKWGNQVLNGSPVGGEVTVGNPTQGGNGVKASAETSGKIGLETHFIMDGGSVNASLPFNVGLDLPNVSLLQTNQQFSIGTFANLQSGSSLSTNFPELQVFSDFVLNAQLDAKVKGCVNVFFVNGCESASFNVLNIDKSFEVFALNRDEDGAFRVLDGITGLIQGVQAAGDLIQRDENGKKKKNPDGTTKKNKTKLAVEIPKPVPTGEPLLTAAARLPDIETLGGLNAAGTAVVSSGQDTFLDLNVDIDGLASAAKVLPPLGAGFNLDFFVGEINFQADLLDIDLQPSLVLEQNFTLTPKIIVDLEFDRAVRAAAAGNVLPGTGVTSLRLDAGQSANVLFDGAFSVSPTYSLVAELRNETGISIESALNIDILKVSGSADLLGINFGSIDFGPVLNKQIEFPNITLGNVFDQKFDIEGFLEAGTGQVSAGGSSFLLTDQRADWVGSTISNWETKSNWDPNVVPDFGQEVSINRSALTIVRMNDSHTISDLTIGRADHTLDIRPGNTLTFDSSANTIANSGSILVGQNAGLEFSGAAILDGNGDGRIRLNGGSISTTGLAEFLNVNNTIEGNGLISGTFQNLSDGVVNATNGVLRIETAAGVGSTQNKGLLRASNSGLGVLLIGPAQGSQDAFIANSDGLIQADGGVVRFDASGEMTIKNGTLSAINGGSIEFAPTTSRINLRNIRNEADLSLDSEDAFLSGNIANVGTIRAHPGPGNAPFDINISTGLTLSGNGILRLDDSVAGTPDAGELVVVTGFGSAVLTNALGHTISGSGNIGNDRIKVINDGLIEANIAGQRLVIDPGDPNPASAGAAELLGTLRASNGGTLLLTDGAFSGASIGRRGTFEALSGGSLKVDSSAILNNLNGGTLRDSIWRADGNGAMLHFLDPHLAPIANLENADVTLSGPGSNFIAGNKLLETSLNSVDSDSALRILAGRDYNRTILATVPLTNHGLIELEGGTWSSPNAAGTFALQNSAGGTLSAFGTINNGVLNQGLLRAENGLLTINDAFQNDGVVEAHDNFIVFKTALGGVTNLSGANLTDGTWRVISDGPSLAGLLFQIPGQPAIEILDADLTLSGANASVITSDGASVQNLRSTLREIGSNGALRLFDGQDFTPTLGGVLNRGELELGGGRFSSTAGTANSGEIFGFGELSGDVTNVGKLTARDGTLRVDGMISQAFLGSKGLIELVDRAELELQGGSIRFGEIVTTSRILNTGVSQLPVPSSAALRGFGMVEDVQMDNFATIRADVDQQTLVLAPGAANVNNRGLMVAENGGILELRGGMFHADFLLAEVAVINDPATAGLDFGVLLALGGTPVQGASEVKLVDAVVHALRAEAIVGAGGGSAVISGFGSLFADQIVIGKGASLSADKGGETLLVDTTAGPGIRQLNSIINGTLLATNGGDLHLNNGTYDVVTGAIEAKGAGSVVLLENVNLIGAEFVTSGGGIIRDIGNSTLDKLRNSGRFVVADGGVVTLTNFADNAGGFITVQTGGALVFDDTVLTGGRIDIDVGATLRGAGQLADVSFSNTGFNFGTITADRAGALSIDTTNAQFVNFGQLQAQGTGGLLIDDLTLFNLGDVAVSALSQLTVVGVYEQTFESGATTTVDGALIADEVRILSGSMGGEGHIFGNVTIGDGATFNAGNSPGTMLITGDFTLIDGATHIIEIAGINPGQFDRLIISDNFFLDGTIVFDLLDSLAPDILTGFNISDFLLTFDALNDPNASNPSPFTDFSIFGNVTFLSTFAGSASSLPVFFNSSDGSLALNQPVPEPSTFYILLLGFIILAGARARTGNVFLSRC